MEFSSDLVLIRYIYAKTKPDCICAWQAGRVSAAQPKLHAKKWVLLGYMYAGSAQSGHLESLAPLAVGRRFVLWNNYECEELNH